MGLELFYESTEGYHVEKTEFVFLLVFLRGRVAAYFRSSKDSLRQSQ